MSFYKRKYIIESLSERWVLPGFTIKDREFFYKKFINEHYDFCEENIKHLYKNLTPWIQKDNTIKKEILTWYRNNSFSLFPFHLFSLLALCSLFQLVTPPLSPEKDTISILLQSIYAALDCEECSKIDDRFIHFCHTELDKKISMASAILKLLLFVKQNCMYKRNQNTIFSISFSMLYEKMCSLSGEPVETIIREKSVSVNTLLVYQSRSEKKEQGMTAILLLEAIPNRFGELYPSGKILHQTRFSESFLTSIKNLELYIKDELRAWPGNVDVRWQLIPDDREINMENKTITGRSLEAAFVIGILKVFSAIDFRGKPDVLQKELMALNLNLAAITATVSKEGNLGKVGGIWKKILEAARVKIVYVIIAQEQTMNETIKLNIIPAATIREAIKKMYKEMGSENVKERIMKFLLTYAIETKELENRCNDAFQGEDLTNIKGSIRFNDKPKIYVKDLMDICFQYGTIAQKHPMMILLEKIEEVLPFSGTDEARELKILLQSTLSHTDNKVIKNTYSINQSSPPGIQINRVIIKKFKSNPLQSTLPSLNKKGNPYINRTTIHHPDLFYGRKKILTWLSRRICSERPQSVSITGERRIGKSSLLNYLTFLDRYAENSDNPGSYIFIYLDCQGLRSISEKQFILTIFTELKKKIKDNIHLNITGNIDDLRFLGQAITTGDLKLILLLDEFESITKNTHFTPAFYSMLRSLANNYTISLITSSVKKLKDMCISREISDSPFFNIFTIHHIGLFDENEATDLITQPSSEHGIPLEQLADRIIKEGGLHPFFLQIMCCSWFDYLKSTGAPAETMEKNETPREVLYQFREEAAQHFEFIYDTMQKKEREILEKIIAGKSGTYDSTDIELLERKGYVIKEKDNTIRFFCTEFERFISQYRM